MRKFAVLWFLLGLVWPLAAQYALPQTLLARAERATKKEFPHANYVTLEDRADVRYQADGTAVEKYESWEKVLTAEGRRDLREIRLHFMAFYGSIEVPVLEVYRPDGKILKIDAAKTGKTAIDSSQMSSNIYDPDHRVFEVALPELAIGDVVHRVVVDKTLRPRIPGVWSGYFTLQSDEPLLSADVVITGPAKKPLRAIALKDRVRDGRLISEKPQRNADGTITWRWHAADVPAAVPEEDMPPLHTVDQRLLVSTAADWKEISRWYDALCEPRINARSKELKEKVAELTRSATTPEEKIARIFHYVSQEIRYLGVTTEKTAPGYEPHDVRETFARKHGVCRDKAALLTAMLREAGFAAYPVLFLVGIPKDAEVPNNYFNHAITAVVRPDGSYQLMDSTGENASLALSSALSNMSYLVARKEGETLRRTGVVPSDRNLVQISSQLAVDNKGTLSGKTAVRFDGINDDLYRNAMVSRPENLRKQFFSGILKHQFPGAELLTLTLTPANLRDRSQKLTAEFTYRVRGYLPPSPTEFPLITPEFFHRFGVVNFLLSNCGPEERKFPLLLDSACGAVEKFEFRLPPDCRIVSLPEKGEINEPGLVTFKRQFTLKKDGLLTGCQELRSHAVEIQPDRYQAFRTALRRVESLCRSCPLAMWDYRYWADTPARAFPGADQLILSHVTAIRLTGPGDWESVEKRSYRILTFAGQENGAELKIRYNPVWEEVKVEAEVQLPDGTRRRVRPAEINLMDEPWVASAPRYPAGKILVVSLPGVVPGATVDYTLTRRKRGRPFFAGSFCFSESNPVVTERLTITAAPSQNPPSFSPAPHGIETFLKTGRGGAVTHVWHTTDVPPYAAEPRQAPDELFALPLHFSNGRYPAYAALLKRTLTEASAGQSQCEALGRKLRLETEKHPLPAAGKQPSLLQRVVVVRDWAARNLRHAGPALNELPLTCLSPGDVTLKSGYGNSADRAIALAAICRGAGIKTRFFASSRLPAIAPYQQFLKHYPQLVFHDVLVEIPELGIYLNDTDEYAAPGALGAHGRIGLELEHGSLVTLRASRGNAPLESVKYIVKIAPNGKARVEATQTFFALDYARNKRFWEKTVGPARQKVIADIVADYSRSAVLNRPPEIDFSGYPGIIRLDFTMPDFAPLQNDYRQFRLPGYEKILNAVPPGSEERSTPFYRTNARRIECEWQILLPPDTRLIPTRRPKVTDGSFGSSRFVSELEQKSGTNGSRLYVRNELLLPSEMIPAHRYGALMQLRKTLSDPAMSRIILKKVKVSAASAAERGK